MATGQMRTYDPSTTLAMLNAFDAAMTECLGVRRGVDDAMSMLQSSYKADASTIYQGGMAKWMDGFARVEKALNLLNVGMGEYRQTAEVTEQTNQGLAGGWAR